MSFQDQERIILILVQIALDRMPGFGGDGAIASRLWNFNKIQWEASFVYSEMSLLMDRMLLWIDRLECVL